MRAGGATLYFDVELMSLKDGPPIVMKGDKSKEGQVGMSYAMSGPFKVLSFITFAVLFGCSVWFAKSMIDNENKSKPVKRQSSKREKNKRR